MTESVTALNYAAIAKPEHRAWRDLRGKVMMVDSPRGNTVYFWRTMARANGLADEEYDFQYAGTTNARYAALKAGAMAYLVKSVARDELTQAIRKAAAGRRHVPCDVAARLADRMSRASLSSRELDVLQLLVGGRRNREIASALDITEGTVKLHVSSILDKLGVVDRTEAVTVALRRGLVRLDR
jgi:DNA-binding CsgD family transcriptional regulator